VISTAHTQAIVTIDDSGIRQPMCDCIANLKSDGATNVTDFLQILAAFGDYF